MKSGLARWIMGKRTALRGLLALVVALMILALLYFISDVRQQLRLLATAYSDNVQWTLSQAEVEAKALETEAARQSFSNAPDLGAVRLRFDIFYSRFATLRDSAIYADLRQDPRVVTAFAVLDTFFDETIPLIDGPDAVLLAELPLLSQKAQQAQAQLRQTSLVGIEIFSRLSDERRASVSRTLLDIALLTIGLLLVLLVLILLLVRVLRRVEATAANLRQMRDRMRTIVSTSLDAIIVTDMQGRIIEYNEAAERTFGYPRAEALGSEMSGLIIPEEMRGMHRKGMERYRSTREKHVIGKGIVQLEALRSNGETFPVDLALASAQAPEGEIIVGFMRDISDRVRSENILRAARDRAIAGEKSKAELLAVMSHEMRTPLNGMLGTLDLFDEERLDSRHRRYLRIIRNSGKTLLGHVNDVLEISRLDAGKMSTNRTRFDLVALLEEIIDGQLGRAVEGGNSLRLRPPSPALHEVYGDPNRIRQILLNLVGNALKFTRNGAVTLEADCHSGLREVEIRVIDTGIGIAEEDIERVFDDFVTIDASYGRSAGGTGLGLAISRRLAAAMGGELGVESEPGEGSVFWLRLPMERPAGPARDPEPASPRHGAQQEAEDFALPQLDILLVEDNATNRIVAREMLERDGHRVFEAHDGLEGVAAAGSRAFDVILMDISMPGMDGLEAARKIRERGDATSEVPIIAATAHAMPDEIAAFLAAGMAGVLVKPLGRSELRRALGAALEVLPGQAAPEAETTTVLPLLDQGQVRELIATLNEADLRRAYLGFLSEMDRFCDQPEAGLGDAAGRAAFAAEAHRMAGTASVFGARRLMLLLRDVQDIAGEASATDLDAMRQTLAACWKETRAALRDCSVAFVQVDA